MNYWPEKLVGIAVSRALLYGSIVGFAGGIVVGILIGRMVH